MLFSLFKNIYKRKTTNNKDDQLKEETLKLNIPIFDFNAIAEAFFNTFNIVMFLLFFSIFFSFFILVF